MVRARIVIPVNIRQAVDDILREYVQLPVQQFFKTLFLPVFVRERFPFGYDFHPRKIFRHPFQFRLLFGRVYGRMPLALFALLSRAVRVGAKPAHRAGRVRMRFPRGRSAFSARAECERARQTQQKRRDSQFYFRNLLSYLHTFAERGVFIKKRRNRANFGGNIQKITVSKNV